MRRLAQRRRSHVMEELAPYLFTRTHGTRSETQTGDICYLQGRDDGLLKKERTLLSLLPRQLGSPHVPIGVCRLPIFHANSVYLCTTTSRVRLLATDRECKQCSEAAPSLSLGVCTLLLEVNTPVRSTFDRSESWKDNPNTHQTWTHPMIR